MEETKASPKKLFSRNDHNTKGKIDKTISKMKARGALKLILFKIKYKPKKNKAKNIEKSLCEVTHGM